MPNRSILVHTCCDPVVGEKPPVPCGCKHHIDKKEREARLAVKELYVVDGEVFKIPKVRMLKTPPQARTIQGRDIVAAYCFDDKDDKNRRSSARERQRIDLFGPRALEKFQSRSKR